MKTRMKIRLMLFSAAFLSGCVSAPPSLTSEQTAKARNMKVFKTGTRPDRKFNVVTTVEAADCSGPGGTRLYGDDGLAIDALKMKAVAAGADAVSDVSCSSVPLMNNCWAAKKCQGDAIKWR